MATNSKPRLIRVPRAAPATPMAGAPSFPKIKTQLKKIFRKKAPMDTIRGTCIFFRFRNTMVVVREKPAKKKQGRAQRR